MDRHPLGALRLQHGRDLAWLAGKRRLDRAAPRQALHQADAGLVASGLPHAIRARAILVSAIRAARRPEWSRLMRLALISDVHANLEALTATFADMSAQAVDRIV